MIGSLSTRAISQTELATGFVWYSPQSMAQGASSKWHTERKEKAMNERERKLLEAGYLYATRFKVWSAFCAKSKKNMSDPQREKLYDDAQRARYELIIAAEALTPR